MRKTIYLWLLAALFASPAPLWAAQSYHGAAAGADITPPEGVPLSGYGKLRGKPTRGTHDRIHARAAALSNGSETFLILSLDLCLIDRTLRAAILEKIRMRHDLEPSSFILTATHTHSGPGAIGSCYWHRFIMGKFDEKIFRLVVDGAAEAGSKALEALKPSRIEYGETRIDGLVENRMVPKLEYPDRVKVLRLSDETGKVTAHLIFMAAHPTLFPAKETMSFSASGEKRPLILISPILGGNMVVDRFAAYYAGRGYIAAIVHRKKPYLSDKPNDLSGIEDYMRTSVIRLRQSLDWALTQPEVDSRRVGAFGISYGAILHTVLAAVDPRIKYHILAMPAGGIAEIIMEVPEKPVRKLVTKAREDFGWSDEKIYSELKHYLQTDPLYFAPYVDRKKVEVYIALFDRVVGAGNSWRLWQELGKPSLKILPFGHYGGVLVFPFLQTQSYLSFRRHLNRE
jgi:dienelactone hydrolase